jgi:hypothetical protein
VKFGGGDAIHHNQTMLEDYLFITLLWFFFGVAQLPCLERDIDLPLITIANVVGYVILWSWELITWYG